MDGFVAVFATRLVVKEPKTFNTPLYLEEYSCEGEKTPMGAVVGAVMGIGAVAIV